MVFEVIVFTNLAVFTRFIYIFVMSKIFRRKASNHLQAKFLGNFLISKIKTFETCLGLRTVLQLSFRIEHRLG